ncbi:MAG: hypothetical protein IT262_18460 [Saprospiraceae bacterium]|nr:hypothetical protein [Saprospiraceae bacterium]
MKDSYQLLVIRVVTFGCRWITWADITTLHFTRNFACLTIVIGIQLYACNRNANVEVKTDVSSITKTEKMTLKITIGAHDFTASLSDNPTADALGKMLPMTIFMTELNGNEKYFELPANLPENASSQGTIRAGDLMLYGSNTLVLFYKTFPTPYRYTPIGRIDDPSELANALGSENISVTFQ